MTQTRNILQSQCTRDDTTAKNWNIVTETLMWSDGLHSKYSPPLVNYCFFNRRKIILLNLVQIKQLLLFFFFSITTHIHYRNLSCTYRDSFLPFHCNTGRVTSLFPVPWSPESAGGEKKSKKRAFEWAAGWSPPTPCVDREFIAPSCTLCDLLNVLRVVIKDALWDFKHKHRAL